MDVGLLESEKALLSSCIQSKDIFYKVNNRLQPSDFSSPYNQLIYQELINLRNDTGFADLATLIDYLNRKKELGKVGGANYLTELITNYTLVLDEVDYYLNTVIDASLLRTFFNELDNIKKDYELQPIEDIPDFIGSAEKRILNITSKRRVADFRNTNDIFQSLRKKLSDDLKFKKENNIKEIYLSGYSSGYEDIDHLTRGFIPGTLIILAARPGVGKTALALNFAHRMAKANRTVGIFSLEMSAEDILKRILCMESKMSEYKIDMLLSNDDPYSNNNSQEQEALNDAISVVSHEKLFIDDNSNVKVKELISQTRKLKMRHPDLSLVVIDYLGLIKGDKNYNSTSNNLLVSDITRDLKIMSKDLNVPVLLLCQLSRGVEFRDGHRPQLADLRDSGSIEQDADQVFFIYREDYYAKNDQSKNKDDKKPQFKENNTQQDLTINKDVAPTTLILAKNRRGKTDDINMTFYKKYYRFESVVADPNSLPPEPTN